MKVISIWQPFASLLISGNKVFETRTWPAPASAIGQTIGIASTKGIKPAQRAYFEDERFVDFYAATGLPPLEELPCGYLLGTALLESSEVMTEEFLEEVSVIEQAFGYFELGNHAWRMVDRRPLEHPIPIRGAQGLYEWNGVLPNVETEVTQAATTEVLEGQREMASEAEVEDRRRGLRIV